MDCMASGASAAHKHRLRRADLLAGSSSQGIVRVRRHGAAHRRRAQPVVEVPRVRVAIDVLREVALGIVGQRRRVDRRQFMRRHVRAILRRPGIGEIIPVAFVRQRPRLVAGRVRPVPGDQPIVAS